MKPTSEATALCAPSSSSTPLQCCATRTEIGLWVAAGTYGAFALIELGFAIAEASNTLQTDAVCQLCDALTYALNAYAEYERSQQWRRSAALVSLAVLFGTTAMSTVLAADALRYGPDIVMDAAGGTLLAVRPAESPPHPILPLVCTQFGASPAPSLLSLRGRWIDPRVAVRGDEHTVQCDGALLDPHQSRREE